MSQPQPRAPLHIVSCKAALPLASSVAAHLHAPLVPTHEVWFACGEGKIEIDANVRGSDLYVFQAPVAPDDPRSLYDRTMMMLHATESAVLASQMGQIVIVVHAESTPQSAVKRALSTIDSCPVRLMLLNQARVDADGSYGYGYGYGYGYDSGDAPDAQPSLQPAEVTGHDR